MPCPIIQGYTLDCKGTIGGIKRILITEKGNVTSLTKVANIITTVTMVTTKQFWEYQLDKENGEFKDDFVYNQVNNTGIYNQEINFSIKKFTTSAVVNIETLAQNFLHVIVEDRNGVYRYFGEVSGMDLVTSNNDSGIAHGDANGFKISLKGIEAKWAHEVNSGIIAALLLPAA